VTLCSWVERYSYFRRTYIPNCVASCSKKTIICHFIFISFASYIILVWELGLILWGKKLKLGCLLTGSQGEYWDLEKWMRKVLNENLCFLPILLLQWLMEGKWDRLDMQHACRQWEMQQKFYRENLWKNSVGRPRNTR